MSARRKSGYYNNNIVVEEAKEAFDAIKLCVPQNIQLKSLLLNLIIFQLSYYLSSHNFVYIRNLNHENKAMKEH